MLFEYQTRAFIGDEQLKSVVRLTCDLICRDRLLDDDQRLSFQIELRQSMFNINNIYYLILHIEVIVLYYKKICANLHLDISSSCTM